MNQECVLYVRFLLCDLSRNSSSKTFHRGLWRELPGFRGLAAHWHHFYTLCGLLKNLGMCGWVWRKCQRSGFPFIRSAVTGLQSHMVQYNLWVHVSFLKQRFFGSKEFTDPYLQHFFVKVLPVEKEIWSSVGIALGGSSPDLWGRRQNICLKFF